MQINCSTLALEAMRCGCASALLQLDLALTGPKPLQRRNVCSRSSKTPSDCSTLKEANRSDWSRPTRSKSWWRSTSKSSPSIGHSRFVCVETLKRRRGSSHDRKRHSRQEVHCRLKSLTSAKAQPSQTASPAARNATRRSITRVPS